jgi:Late embryogenesis abundant protein
MLNRILRPLGLAILLALSASCQSLGALANFVRPPTFENVPDQPADLRLMPPSLTSPLGGANVRMWTRVTNPNPFGFTLSSLHGTLLLEASRAATADFPLGLPLDPGQSTTIPIDLSVDFRDVPGLADLVRRAFGRQPIDYAFEGTVGVSAGRSGPREFGPLTIVRGTIR